MCWVRQLTDSKVTENLAFFSIANKKVWPAERDAGPQKLTYKGANHLFSSMNAWTITFWLQEDIPHSSVWRKEILQFVRFHVRRDSTQVHHSRDEFTLPFLLLLLSLWSWLREAFFHFVFCFTHVWLRRGRAAERVLVREVAIGQLGTRHPSTSEAKAFCGSSAKKVNLFIENRFILIIAHHKTAGRDSDGEMNFESFQHSHGAQLASVPRIYWRALFEKLQSVVCGGGAEFGYCIHVLQYRCMMLGSTFVWAMEKMGGMC